MNLKSLPKTCPVVNAKRSTTGVEKPREKLIARRLERNCTCCGKKIKVILYKDRTCRSGHYFGKVPIHSKKELDKAIKSGSHKETIAGFTIDVLNYDPKPYKYEEYWECPKCYWGGK